MIPRLFDESQVSRARGFQTAPPHSPVLQCCNTSALQECNRHAVQATTIAYR